MTAKNFEMAILEAGIAPEAVNPAGYACTGCGRTFPPFALMINGDDLRCACCLIDADRAAALPPVLTWNDIRGERAVELAGTDWTQNPDVPAQTRLRWQDYRQAWRDITAQDCSPADVVRPTTPE